MKKKIPVVIIAVAIIVISIFNYYNYHFSNAVILKNVTSSNGYSFTTSKEPIDIEFHVKPEWIPFDSDEPKDLNIKLCKKNNTDIMLTQVWNRGGDIYFSFDTLYHLNYIKGKFLYNGLFYKNGLFVSKSNITDFLVFDTENNPINIGQTGSGPNSGFSFGIEPEEYSKIKDGFNVKYSGMILYTYSLDK
jgi:hypothetical protein